MKAITATTEAKSLEPGLSLRAEQSVVDLGFYQIFFLAGLGFPEGVIAQGEEGSLDHGEHRINADFGEESVQDEDWTSSDFSVLASSEMVRSQLVPSRLDRQVPDGMVVNSDQLQLQPISLAFADNTEEGGMPWLAPVGAKISAVPSDGPTTLKAALIDPSMMHNIKVARHPTILEESLAAQIVAAAALDCPDISGHAVLLIEETDQDVPLPDYAVVAHPTAKSLILSTDANQQVSLTQASQVDLALLTHIVPDDPETLKQRAEVMVRGVDGSRMQAEHGPDLDASSFQKPGEDMVTATGVRSPVSKKPDLSMWPKFNQRSLLLGPLVQPGKPEGLQPVDIGGNRLDLVIAETRVVPALAGMPAKQDASVRSDGPTSKKSAALFVADAASNVESVKSDLIQPANERAEGSSSISSGARSSFAKAQPPAPLTAALPFSATLNMRQEGWGKQLLGHIERMVASGSQRIELSLRPKNLGEIQVLIGMSGEQTTVQIMTETAAAARLLDGGEDRLAQILDQSGYRLSSFSAHEHGSGTLGGHHGQHRHSSPRRNRTLAESTQREETSEAVSTSTHQAGRSLESGINMIA